MVGPMLASLQCFVMYSGLRESGRRRGVAISVNSGGWRLFSSCLQASCVHKYAMFPHHSVKQTPGLEHASAIVNMFVLALHFH